MFGIVVLCAAATPDLPLSELVLRPGVKPVASVFHLYVSSFSTLT